MASWFSGAWRARRGTFRQGRRAGGPDCDTDGLVHSALGSGKAGEVGSGTGENYAPALGLSGGIPPPAEYPSPGLVGTLLAWGVVVPVVAQAPPDVAVGLVLYHSRSAESRHWQSEAWYSDPASLGRHGTAACRNLEHAQRFEAWLPGCLSMLVMAISCMLLKLWLSAQSLEPMPRDRNKTWQILGGASRTAGRLLSWKRTE
ncbi:hypothetical protein MHYP_G00268240 [Metynnis hypsauchen]